ncbi:hypothetical protein BOX15_Mlig014337g4 [Macrostomum lignano]|uniref:Uncharacterized protein n=2 Tax=Macrostomum lignano TaxID=282301 RepID=A0A267FLD3_9PLAT|nr:hypothetical protein BOX15_Mlig014337g4 [Macrostomum lignano]
MSSSAERNKKGCGYHISTGLSRTSRILALITALCVAATLLYVFVLLVPAWRIVHVDSQRIGALLTNSSSSSSSNEEIRKQQEALSKDPLLRNRTANAFRECMQSRQSLGSKPTQSINSTSKVERQADEKKQEQQEQQLSSNATELMSNVLEILAGFVNATNKDGRNQSVKVAENTSSDHCWFIDLRWSSSSPETSDGSQLGQRYLDCLRAIFLLAVGLLLCHCLSLTGTLYACFSSRLPRPCFIVLLTSHSLILSQLVAAAILQDVSTGLESRRLQQLLDSAGFPSAAGDAVSVARGNWCLAFLCLLCCLTAAQMILLMLLAPVGKSGIYRPNSDAATAAMPDKAGTDECDATEDTNPLI